MNQHPNLSTTFKAAMGLILLRLLLFFFGINSEFLDTGFVFLALASLIPLTIYAIWPRGQNKDFLQEIKTSMRITGLFGLIVVVFLFLFYQFIETEYFELTRDEILNRELIQYSEQNNGQPMPEAESAELKQNIESFFSLNKYTAIVLVLFVILSGFYALVFTVLKRLLIRPK